jgi:hypothetical protein
MTVYALRDPRTGAARYVGCSSRVQERWREHIRRAAHGETKAMPAGLRAWLTELSARGLDPTLECLEDTDTWDAESRWIRTLRDAGEPLLNECDGGRGIPGYKHRPENIAKFAAALRGQAKSAAARVAMAEAARRRRYSESAHTRLRRHAAAIRPLVRPLLGERNGQAKLTSARVEALRALYGAGGITLRTLAAQFGVSEAAIHHAVTRKTWRHVG